jgi:hypothetical protein
MGAERAALDEAADVAAQGLEMVEVVEPEPDPVTGQILHGVDLDTLLKEKGPKVQPTTFRQLVIAYIGAARGNLTAAARMVGYRNPEMSSSAYRRRNRELFDALDEAVKNQRVMGVEEWDKRVTWLARNPRHRDHYKGLELWGKVLGRVSDKLNVTIDRPALNNQLVELVKLLVESKRSQLEPTTKTITTQALSATTQPIAVEPPEDPNR